MASNGQLRTPFSRPSTIRKVLSAPRGMFDAAIRFCVQKNLAPTRDRIFGAVRVMQTT